MTLNRVAVNPASYVVVTGENVEVSASVTDDTHAKFNVENMAIGNEVTFTYYIANLSNDLGAKITPTVTSDNEVNFEVTVNPDSEFNLDENEVQEVVVTVKCIAQNKLDASGSFEVSFETEATE